MYNIFISIFEYGEDVFSLNVNIDLILNFALKFLYSIPKIYNIDEIDIIHLPA